MDLNPEAIAKSPFTIGALGALVTAAKFTPGASWWERGINVVGGSLAAGFVTPALTEYLKMTSHAYIGGASFFVGLLGMSLVAAFFQMVRDVQWAQIVSGWIARR